MGIIEIRGVQKRFGKQLILNNVDLDVKEKDIFGIIGVNGSGKTTLLKIIIGFYKASQGKVLYNSKDMRKVFRKVRKDFGFTSQDSSFYPKLTVRENMYYFGALYGLPKHKVKENMTRILKLVDLEYAKKVLAQNLSGGMQRRLDLACSIIHNPKILILDEPTEDLDPLLRREIVEVIKKINKLGTTIIITSHILEDIESLCDTVAILHKKEIMNVGSVEDLRKLYRRQEEIHLETESGKYEKIIRSARLKDVELEGDKLIVYTDKAEKTLHVILHVIENSKDKLVYADVRKPTLSEIFAELTKTKKLKR